MDRLTVLRKYVKGDPRALVAALEVTDANYTVVVQLLEENYGHISVERQEVMSMLFTLSQVRSPIDTVGLRKLLSKIQAGIKSFEGLGNPLAAYALAFEPRLRAAVPSKLVYDVLRMKRLAKLASPATPESSAGDALSQSAGFVSEFVDYLVRYTSRREESAAIDSASGEKDHDRRKRPSSSKDQARD